MILRRWGQVRCKKKFIFKKNNNYLVYMNNKGYIAFGVGYCVMASYTIINEIIKKNKKN